MMDIGPQTYYVSQASPLNDLLSDMSAASRRDVQIKLGCSCCCVSHPYDPQLAQTTTWRVAGNKAGRVCWTSQCIPNFRPTPPDAAPGVLPPQFSGYAVDPIPTMKADQLVQQLRAAGKPVKEGFFVVAGYDPVRRASSALSVPYDTPATAQRFALGTLPVFVLLSESICRKQRQRVESATCLRGHMKVHGAEAPTTCGKSLFCCLQPYRLTHRHNEIWIMKADEERERH